MPFDLLPTLHPRFKHWTICVRVSRKWEYRGGTDDGPIAHVDLVLVDEKGNAMYGEIPSPEIDTKSHLLQEGEIYIMNRFRVSNAKSLYRPVDARYMIEFTCYTKVTPVKEHPPAFPKYVYTLTPFADLSSYAGENKNFLDVIGIITEITDAGPVQLPNQPNPTLSRDIILKDLSNFEIKVTLWGQRAAQFNIDDIYDNAEAKPIVVLFVGNLMKSFAGQEYLSGNSACRWYFNPAIPEAEEFYTALQNQRLQIKRAAAPVQQLPQPHAPVQIEDRYLQDLEDMDPYDWHDGGCRCTVTIARLVPDVSWWFASCNKCSKSCSPDGTGYRCNACSCTGYKFKYKLSFIATDGTAEAEMICFGDVARRIIGKPVQAVLRATRYADDGPPDIAAIVSLKFKFAITLTEQSYYKREKTYQVNSIITAYGRQSAIPRLASTGQSSTQMRLHPGVHPIDPFAAPHEGSSGSGPKSPTASDTFEAPKIADQLPLLDNTPPAPLEDTETSIKKDTLLGDTDVSNQSNVRKRLFQEGTILMIRNKMLETKKDKKEKIKTTDETSNDALLHFAGKKIAGQQGTSVSRKTPDPRASRAQKNN